MPTVLVVDDSAMDRRLVGGILQEDKDLTIEYAADGVEALKKIHSAEPDIVLTDLQMPEMDGLELVTKIRFEHPKVPVVLMTAHGSETVAARALEQGAASYVPKSQLADKLRTTVEDIFALSRADRSYERLIDCSTLSKFCFVLDNDAGLIDPLVDLVQQMVGSMHICDATGQLQVGVALEQALLNAFFRGNLEISARQLKQIPASVKYSRSNELIEQRLSQPPYCDRKTLVDVEITRDVAKFIICDEGRGFDVSSATVEASLGQEGGRGLVLMRSFMDEVHFNAAGNEVTLIKRRVE